MAWEQSSDPDSGRPVWLNAETGQVSMTDPGGGEQMQTHWGVPMSQADYLRYSAMTPAQLAQEAPQVLQGMQAEWAKTVPGQQGVPLGTPREQWIGMVPQSGFGDFLKVAAPLALGAAGIFGGGLSSLLGPAAEIAGPPAGFMGPLAPGAGLETQLAANGFGAATGAASGLSQMPSAGALQPTVNQAITQGLVPGVDPAIGAASFTPSLPSMPTTPNLPGTNSPTLPTVPGGTETVIPGTAAPAAGAATGGLSGLLNNALGTNLNGDDMKLLGSLGATGLGLLASNQQTSALKDLYNQSRQDTAPTRDLYNKYLTDPNSFYTSPQAQGASDAVMRSLSANGNPWGNPSDLGKAAAFNLGGYNQTLGMLAGNAGLGNASTTASLGSQMAQSQATPYNVLSAGLGEVTNPKTTLADLLKQFQGSAQIA